MTYFDPKTYDWKKLKGKDRVFMGGYNYCIDRVRCAIDFVCDECGYKELPPTISKMIKEIQKNMGEEVLDYIKHDRPMITASFMDGNEEYEDDDIADEVSAEIETKN